MTIFPHQGETPASLLATVAVKSAVAPRNQLNDHVNSALVAGLGAAMRDKTTQRVVGAEMVGVEFLALADCAMAGPSPPPRPILVRQKPTAFLN